MRLLLHLLHLVFSLVVFPGLACYLRLVFCFLASGCIRAFAGFFFVTLLDVAGLAVCLICVVCAFVLAAYVRAVGRVYDACEPRAQRDDAHGLTLVVDVGMRGQLLLAGEKRLKHDQFVPGQLARVHVEVHFHVPVGHGRLEFEARRHLFAVFPAHGLACRLVHEHAFEPVALARL